MEPFERSTVQLMSIIRRDKEKDKTNSFPYTSKTHATLTENDLFHCLQIFIS